MSYLELWTSACLRTSLQRAQCCWEGWTPCTSAPRLPPNNLEEAWRNYCDDIGKKNKKAQGLFFPDPSLSVQQTHLTWAGGSGHSGTVPWTLRCAWQTPPRTGLHGWSGWHTAATARPGARTKHTQFRLTCSRSYIHVSKLFYYTLLYIIMSH